MEAVVSAANGYIDDLFDSVESFTIILSFMGCVASKQTVSVTPACDQYSGTLRENDDSRSHVGSDTLVSEFDMTNKVKKRGELSGLSGGASELNESGKEYSNGDQSVSLMKYVEGEQAAAGWPVWLSTVAAEAIHGWLPLKPESFQKLDKVSFKRNVLF